MRANKRKLLAYPEWFSCATCVSCITAVNDAQLASGTANGATIQLPTSTPVLALYNTNRRADSASFLFFFFLVNIPAREGLHRVRLSITDSSESYGQHTVWYLLGSTPRTFHSQSQSPLWFIMSGYPPFDHEFSSDSRPPAPSYHSLGPVIPTPNPQSPSVVVDAADLDYMDFSIWLYGEHRSDYGTVSLESQNSVEGLSPSTWSVAPSGPPAPLEGFPWIPAAVAAAPPSVISQTGSHSLGAATYTACRFEALTTAARHTSAQAAVPSPHTYPAPPFPVTSVTLPPLATPVPVVPPTPAAISSKSKVKRYRNYKLNVSATGEFIAIYERNIRESPLLCLPAEIRNMIMCFVLGDKVFKIHLRWSFTILDTNTGKEIAGDERKNMFAVLEVCRQLYEEANPLPFVLNTFERGDVLDFGKSEISGRRFGRQWQWDAITNVTLPTTWIDLRAWIKYSHMQTFSLEKYKGLRKMTFKLKVETHLCVNPQEMLDATIEYLTMMLKKVEELQAVRPNPDVQVVVDYSLLEDFVRSKASSGTQLRINSPLYSAKAH
ncbi:hypothetical protein P154DRAFT_537132 [Amniculicola lignicola CBS 123094]|uniref:Uncharacterized protein n=1 Tax=Amniculicola lignicola CBS 123094 TaxID=1392246 RepID=A0A6A5WBC2_9PLEO|nr:hypothetical protein P154DRAFT_537132 [Amniculicola lignicola CBS 123094]